MTLVGPVALAQTQAPAAQPAVQKVIVTGSNIKRGIDEQTASPVQVLSREEIKATGASTVREILDTITSSNQSTLSDLTSGNSFSSGATGVGLRNLGKGSTLTLVNGRRMPNFGTADGGRVTFVNIDSIPTEVIERVEVLLDGASAIYGSDAVAGVINIITKKDYNGLVVKAGARQNLNKSDLDRDQTASITGGIGDFNADGWNVYGNLELYHRNPYTDRAVLNQFPDWYFVVNPSTGVRSTYSTPGNYIGRYPANYPDPKLAGTAISTPAPGCKPENLEGGLCRFDQWDRVGIHAEADRVNFMSSGRLKIDDNLTAFAEVQLSDTKSTFYNAPAIMQYTGTPSRWYNATERRLEFFTEPMLPAGHPYNPYSFPIQLRYRYADNLDMYKSEATARQYRAMAGLEGTHFGWDWNSAIGIMSNRSETKQRGTKHAKNYLDAVLSGAYKFGQVNDEALLLKMFPKFGFLGESKQSFIDIRASRELMQLSGGPLSLAVGGEYRRDSFESWVSDNVKNAELVGYGSIAVTGSRNIYSAYAELAAPVIKDLELNGAVRFDKVGSTDANFVPKLAARYQLHPTLLVRGTVSQGFRAPNAAETGKVSLSAFNNGIQDPKRCAIATQLFNELNKGNALDKADALRARDAGGCAASAAVDVAGNPDLAPEKSRSVNAGTVWQPTKDLSMSLDYYRIERRDEIGTRDVSQILATEDQIPGSVQRMAVTDDDRRMSDRVFELTGKRISHTTGPISAISKSYQNLNRTKVSGLDFELNHRINLGSYGKVINTLRANYQLDLRGWDTVTDTYTENLVGNYDNAKYRLRFSSQWSNGPYKAGATVTYTPATLLIDDKYDEQNTVEGCEARGYPAEYCTVNRDVLVNVNAAYTLMKNTTFYANVDNVFNRKPVLDIRGLEPRRGRVLRVQIEHKF
ncbi:TonB-dependent receptor domain-containing protein [Pseudoduganella sp.]|uniref:TonB-dependent receptor domain-containing protein n=1 Tax=Pseudoduganella sp. TaxID=1880898 RepID=UPI0035AFD6AB